jgi:hypothetical protein
MDNLHCLMNQMCYSFCSVLFLMNFDRRSSLSFAHELDDLIYYEIRFILPEILVWFLRNLFSPKKIN